LVPLPAGWFIWATGGLVGIVLTSPRFSRGANWVIDAGWVAVGVGVVPLPADWLIWATTGLVGIVLASPRLSRGTIWVIDAGLSLVTTGGGVRSCTISGGGMGVPGGGVPSRPQRKIRIAVARIFLPDWVLGGMDVAGPFSMIDIISPVSIAFTL
jgi:hypothetical protein